jgi:hypothetical protein
MASKQTKQKPAHREKKANLGQREAKQEKEKEAELSHMGKKIGKQGSDTDRSD